MELAGRHVVVTGGGGGIGGALARAVSEEGAGAVVVADRDLAAAQAVAEQVGGSALQFDAARESSVRELIATATEAGGAIDVFISNAGVPGDMGGPEAPDEAWE